VQNTPESGIFRIMPTALPIELPITAETLRLISEVDRYQGHWSAARLSRGSEI